MSWIRICPIEEILPDTGVAALVEGRQLAVFRLLDGAVYALDNRDPFSDANVLARGIVGDLGGDPMVASPIYKHHFRLSDGVCLEDPQRAVATYPVRLVDGWVEVDRQAQAVADAA